MSGKKRVRTPQPKPDHLIVAWGRTDPYNHPSLVYVYPDRAGKCDSRVLMEAIEGPRYRPSSERYGSFEKEPSLAQELEARGYDLTTLRITIRKKETTP